MSLEDHIKTEAIRLGFDFIGITSVVPPASHVEVYQAWIEQEFHAGMGYLASPEAVNRRADPTLILPGALSVISLGIKYPISSPQKSSISAYSGIISSYARGPDYHVILKKKLIDLTDYIHSIAMGNHNLWYTDTGALLERTYGQQAGLGWIGRNSSLISREHGSYFFLAEILTDLPLEPDQLCEKDFCGSCRKCVDACPTACINENRTINSNRCVSYLTIENKGAIPHELRHSIGSNIFGCDICQACCPWNVKTSLAKGNSPIPSINGYPDLRDEIMLSEEQFKSKYGVTPVKRAHRRGYLRNVAVALGNMRDGELFPLLESSMNSESDPLVRGHITWAISQTPHRQSKQALAKMRVAEADQFVLDEIDRGLATLFK